ncbi:MAG: hypothetical protein ACK4TP_01085 [Hyphomicrobium sp.]|jgi:hypothetical protein
MSKPQRVPATSLTPLPSLLNVVGEELGHLAADVERLHDIVELPGVRDSLRAAKCFDVLQGIDHVTQNLAALSEFLTTLASATPDEWAVDANGARDELRLASLSERLKQPTLPRPSSGGGDECEFF